MKCITIRKAGRNDMQNFMKIYESAYSGMKKYFYDSKKDEKRYFKWLLNHSDGFFIAEINEAIAFIACDSDWIGYNGLTGAIHEIAIKKEWKNKGLGETMVRIGETFLKNAGCKSIELWVGKENRNAIKFYENLGFIATHEGFKLTI